jgi:hypothetical protein
MRIPKIAKLNRNKRKSKMSTSYLRKQFLRTHNRPEPPQVRKNCNKKRRYASEETAQEMCNLLNERVVIQEVAATVYYCHRHSAWHVGHDRLRARRAK